MNSLAKAAVGRLSPSSSMLFVCDVQERFRFVHSDVFMQH